eukprot:SAG31_NODE_6909_length_1854_cov_1.378917_1_plen_231_part_00
MPALLFLSPAPASPARDIPSAETDDQMQNRTKALPRIDYRAYLSALGVAYGKSQVKLTRWNVMSNAVCSAACTSTCPQDEKISHLFFVFDADGSATLDLSEFTTLCSCIPSCVKDIDYMAWSLWTELDVDGDGNLSLSEFSAGIKTVPQFVRYFRCAHPRMLFLGPEHPSCCLYEHSLRSVFGGLFGLCTACALLNYCVDQAISNHTNVQGRSGCSRSDSCEKSAARQRV